MLSCIFVMHFSSFFHFPNQKFICPSILSVWLEATGGAKVTTPPPIRACEAQPNCTVLSPAPTDGQQERTPSEVQNCCLLFHEGTLTGPPPVCFPHLVPPSPLNAVFMSMSSSTLLWEATQSAFQLLFQLTSSLQDSRRKSGFWKLQDYFILLVIIGK